MRPTPTVGDDFKEAAQSRLIDIAREALKLHSTFEGRKITNSDDLAAFDYDFTHIETAVRDIGTDVKILHRYYRDGGTE